ncbi:MAG TPA: phosphate transport system regulatory protein PhoU [Candidatus Atribacteria bacterium]|nr:phosphate transport system regulatory protein PhoU [Candidatus Atribacteria bacterium]
MERQFDQELNILKEDLLKMASLTEEAVAKSIKALVERDSNLAQEVIDRDREVNLLEIEINNQCLKLLALKQPMAIDLRFITSVMKIISHLERIADQAVNISQRTLKLIKQPLLKPLIDIPRMAELAQEMVINSVDSLVNKDSLLAKRIGKRDNLVDDLNDQIFRELLTYMIEDPRTIKRAIELILVGRHLERIADLATNISEEVVFILNGKNIKHPDQEK